MSTARHSRRCSARLAQQGCTLLLDPPSAIAAYETRLAAPHWDVPPEYVWNQQVGGADGSCISCPPDEVCATEFAFYPPYRKSHYNSSSNPLVYLAAHARSSSILPHLQSCALCSTRCSQAQNANQRRSAHLTITLLTTLNVSTTPD